MRLASGVLAASAFESRLVGDASLSTRPMERVAEPLRRMGSDVRTTEGHAPISIRGGPLRGIRHEPDVPSAQVKSAVLLAGVAAEGETSVVEPAPTRDHTERALEHLGAPVRREGPLVAVAAFEHDGFAARVPGDVSSAAFLVAAAALSRGAVSVLGVGLNPSRTHVLDVLGRMGVRTRVEVEGHELGEPVGRLDVGPAEDLVGTTVSEEELPLLIDEVPVLAVLGAHARTETRILGAAELRVKESDRLTGLADGIRALGGEARVEGDDLVIAGGGLRGGTVSSLADHRIAMAFAVAALGAGGPVVVDGIEAADVSFPGFLDALRSLGASVEP
jgi:3-phosphoshikimate 1-carboxyvinyltransferase